MASNPNISQQFKTISETLFGKVSQNCSGLSESGAKQKVFISYCYGTERAQIVKGIGNSLKTAYEAARNQATKAIAQNGTLPIWIMIDIITKETTVTLQEYYKMLEKSRRGYLRYGVAFDEMYNTAFLEQEIYGSSLIKYIKSNNQFFNRGNINSHISKHRQNTTKLPADFFETVDASGEKVDKPIIIFETKGYFYDEGEYIPLEPSSESFHKGLRPISFGNTPEEQSHNILALTHKTANSLLSTVNEDGSFVYGYYPCFSKVCAGYNVPRHALAVYSLADLYLLSPNPKYKENALLALEYLIDTYVYHHDNETAFIIDPVREDNIEIKLGALGMSILAITKCMETLDKNNNSVENERWNSYIPLLRKIGNGILYMQNKETGNYTHVLSYPSMEVKEEFRIVYYAGEACFALTRLYTVDRDPKWMDAIELAFDFFIANDYHKFSDHWLAYAVNEVSLYRTEDKFYEFGLKNAFYDLDFVIKRDTTWNTFLEMLNVSVMVVKKMQEMGKHHLLEKYDLIKLNHALETRFNRQLSSIMLPEMAMFFKEPFTVLYGIFIRHQEFRVRNDDVAHHLMGYCNYHRLKFSPNASSNSKSTCVVYSVDRNARLAEHGSIDFEMEEGLGHIFIVYLALKMLFQKKIALTDMIKIGDKAAREKDKSLVFTAGEEVSLKTLLDAQIVANAPGAMIALANYVFKMAKTNKKAYYKEICSKLSLSEKIASNVTGRKSRSSNQRFTIQDLEKIAAFFFTLPLDALKPLTATSALHNGQLVETNSVMHSMAEIISYYCFGESGNHAIALAKINGENIVACVLGAKNAYERDAAICNAIQNLKTTNTAPKWIQLDTFDNFSGITIAGDTYFGEWYTRKRKLKGKTDALQEYGYGYSFEKIAHLLPEYDYNIVNFEAVLTTQHESPNSDYYSFILDAMPNETLQELKRRNIKGVMMANNHALDFGEASARLSKQQFIEQGFSVIGFGDSSTDAEMPLCLSTGDRQVLIFNAYWLRGNRHRTSRHYAMGIGAGCACLADSLLNTIAKYRLEYPHAFIVFSPHWGQDFKEPNKYLKRMAKELIEIGVDCIIGHGSHIISDFEYINGKFVIYQIGNFVFNHNCIEFIKQNKPKFAYMPKLFVNKEETKLRLYPLMAYNPYTFWQPRPITDDEFAELQSHHPAPPNSIKKVNEEYFLEFFL